jgi:hypothetical protein
MYRIERQDQLYKTLPQALSFSPTIVIFSALMLLLPLPGVFAPGSLTVVPENFTNVPGNCTIPTGNLLNSGSFSNGPENVWTGITPKATQLTRQWFMEQHIPDLPQACGPNCRYKVHIPSSALQCTPNPSSLPNGQSNWNSDSYVRTLWNGTAVDLLGFYIAWQSNDIAGTSGNAFCSFSQAHYDIEVWIIASLSISLSLICLNVNSRFRQKQVPNL